jgi:hypothetical protein
MSYNGAAYILRGMMSIWEIHKRFGPVQAVWWKFTRGDIIEMPWPNGLIVHYIIDGSKVEFMSSDPNDHFRPWLEKNVGKQGWDWDWRHKVVDTMITPGYENETASKDTLLIKFRKKHKEKAFLFKLKFS